MLCSPLAPLDSSHPTVVAAAAWIRQRNQAAAQAPTCAHVQIEAQSPTEDVPHVGAPCMAVGAALWRALEREARRAACARGRSHGPAAGGGCIEPSEAGAACGASGAVGSAPLPRWLPAHLLPGLLQGQRQGWRYKNINRGKMVFFMWLLTPLVLKTDGRASLGKKLNYGVK
jgi:hypothetical protein